MNYMNHVNVSNFFQLKKVKLVATLDLIWIQKHFYHKNLIFSYSKFNSIFHHKKLKPVFIFKICTQ